MEVYINTSIYIISLDGKTGSNLVNLDGRSDSNNITLVGGSSISVIENPIGTYTVNAITTGGQYLNPDKNLVIDNVLDTTNLSSTISTSSASISTIHNYQINSCNTCSTNVSAGNLTASYLVATDLINVGDGHFSNISALHNTIINSSTANMSIIK